MLRVKTAKRYMWKYCHKLIGLWSSHRFFCYGALVQFHAAQREISIKLVYYGPPLSGKTTNLQMLHRMLNPNARGELTTLNTADDRTLFFDLLPVFVQNRTGYTTKLKLLTVPGQVIHVSTRRVVLQGADGVVFVADSQRSMSKANNDFWHGMRAYLTEHRLNPDTLPTVIQFNKRDLPDTRSDAELDDIRRHDLLRPVFSAVAMQGDGVLETFLGLLKLVFDDLEAQYKLEERFSVRVDEVVNNILQLASSSPSAEQ